MLRFFIFFKYSLQLKLGDEKLKKEETRRKGREEKKKKKKRK